MVNFIFMYMYMKMNMIRYLVYILEHVLACALQHSTVELLLKDNPEIWTPLAILRILFYISNMLSYYKITPEMRTPLYTGHYTSPPPPPPGVHIRGDSTVLSLTQNMDFNLSMLCSRYFHGEFYAVCSL